jgi:hypothetical protein
MRFIHSRYRPFLFSNSLYIVRLDTKIICDKVSKFVLLYPSRRNIAVASSSILFFNSSVAIMLSHIFVQRCKSISKTWKTSKVSIVKIIESYKILRLNVFWWHIFVFYFPIKLRKSSKFSVFCCGFLRFICFGCVFLCICFVLVLEQTKGEKTTKGSLCF